MMFRDAIVEEVRNARRKSEEACDHDWKKLIAHYRRINTGQSRVVCRQPKRRPAKPAVTSGSEE